MAKAAPASNFLAFLEGLSNGQATKPVPPSAVPAVRQISAGLGMLINGLKAAPPEATVWYDEFVREHADFLEPLLSAKMTQAASVAAAAEAGALDPLLSRIADSTAAAVSEEFGELHAKIDGLKVAAGPTAADIAAEIQKLATPVPAAADVAGAVHKLISPELAKILAAFKAPASAPEK